MLALNIDAWAYFPGNTVVITHSILWIFRDFAFKPQTKEMIEVGAHQTMGVDLYVTSERVIILDTQVIWKSTFFSLFQCTKIFIYGILKY